MGEGNLQFGKACSVTSSLFLSEYLVASEIPSNIYGRHGILWLKEDIVLTKRFRNAILEQELKVSFYAEFSPFEAVSF